jgi:hypothetical protein
MSKRRSRQSPTFQKLLIPNNFFSIMRLKEYENWKFVNFMYLGLLKKTKYMLYEYGQLAAKWI